MTKRPWQIHLLILFSLIGIILSVLMTQHFYEIRNGSAGFVSFCNLGRGANCDLVAASRYAEFFFGLPISGFAVGWFLSFFIISLCSQNVFWRRETVRALFLLSSIGTLISIAYFVIMIRTLHTLCLFCLGVDLVNLCSLGLVLSLKPEKTIVHKLDRNKWKLLLGIIIISLVISPLTLAWIYAKPLDEKKMEEIIERILQSTPQVIDTGSRSPSIGIPTASITIVEFSDFQCPHCRQGAQIMNSLVLQNPEKIRIVMKNYPLDPSCNRLVQHAMHSAACEAARAAICAHDQGKFKEAYEYLFQNQASIAPDQVATLVQSVGIEKNQLLECMKSTQVLDALARDISEGDRLGIMVTPTFFINGHKVEGLLPVPTWQKLIQKLL